MNPEYKPNVAIIVRSRNDGDHIANLLESIKEAESEYGARVDTIFVDTESHDSTLDQARQFGATVVPIAQDEFTYPNSLNLGLAAVADDVEVAFLTVGHAQPVDTDFLKMGIRHFSNPWVTGVYGVTVPNEIASMTERLFAARYHKAPHRISRVGMGTMGATNAMIRMSTWRQHPFDEEYAGGGEDTEWARQAIKKGEHIMFDPALNVRHSHGLAAIDSFKQWLHWRAVFNGPTHFKRSK